MGYAVERQDRGRDKGKMRFHRDMVEEIMDDADEVRELNLSSRPAREERRRYRERERLERGMARNQAGLQQGDSASEYAGSRQGRDRRSNAGGAGQRDADGLSAPRVSAYRRDLDSSRHALSGLRMCSTYILMQK